MSVVRFHVCVWKEHMFNKNRQVSVCFLLLNKERTVTDSIQNFPRVCKQHINLWMCFFMTLGIENLPCELQRNFTLMRELDNRAEGEMTPGLRLKSYCAVYLGSVSGHHWNIKYELLKTQLGWNGWMSFAFAFTAHQWTFDSYFSSFFAEKKCEIDKLAEEYIKNVRNLAPDQRVEHLQKIQNGFSKCKEYSDDKVQLAMQTYEMVSNRV